MDETFSLGARLRALRRERGLTQRDLAGRADVSANAISLIERSEISPSVATLQRLAAALKVKMSFFFVEDERQTDIMHVKAGECLSIADGGVTIETIGRRLREQQIEPFLIALIPRAESGRRQVIHTGHEFVYCLRGRVEYEIDGNVYLLEEGDMLLFEAELPHHWRNPGPDESRLLLILQTPDESYDPVRRHFPGHLSLPHVAASK
jgi:transcriptional regulator with XRE-family HTH domain